MERVPPNAESQERIAPGTSAYDKSLPEPGSATGALTSEQTREDMLEREIVQLQKDLFAAEEEISQVHSSNQALNAEKRTLPGSTRQKPFTMSPGAIRILRKIWRSEDDD